MCPCIALPFLSFFFFAFGNFANYIVVLLKVLQSEIWNRICHAILFPRILDLLSLSSGGPVVPLVCGFRRRDNLLVWRELIKNLHELESRIWFWEECIHFERIHSICRFDRFSWNLAETFQGWWKQKGVGKFLFSKYFSRSVQLRITSRIF